MISVLVLLGITFAFEIVCKMQESGTPLGCKSKGKILPAIPPKSFRFGKHMLSFDGEPQLKLNNTIIPISLSIAKSEMILRPRRLVKRDVKKEEQIKVKFFNLSLAIDWELNKKFENISKSLQEFIDKNARVQMQLKHLPFQIKFRVVHVHLLKQDFLENITVADDLLTAYLANTTRIGGVNGRVLFTGKNITTLKLTESMGVSDIGNALWTKPDIGSLIAQHEWIGNYVHVLYLIDLVHLLGAKDDFRRPECETEFIMGKNYTLPQFSKCTFDDLKTHLTLKDVNSFDDNIGENITVKVDTGQPSFQLRHTEALKTPSKFYIDEFPEFLIPTEGNITSPNPQPIDQEKKQPENTTIATPQCNAPLTNQQSNIPQIKKNKK